MASKKKNSRRRIKRGALKEPETLQSHPAQSRTFPVVGIGLPGEDGYTVVRKVRALPPDKGGAIPAIALTAYGRAEDRVRALAAGFHLHIAKPVEPDELAGVILSLINRFNTCQGS